LVVFVRKKDRLAIIASLNDVLRDFNERITGLSGHGLSNLMCDQTLA
jgi:hypothetical protein